MSDEPSLAFLQELVQRVLDGQKDMTREMHALTHRVSNLETGFGLMKSQIAEMSGRLDHVNECLDRIEPRLDLRNGPAT